MSQDHSRRKKSKAPPSRTAFPLTLTMKRGVGRGVGFV